MIVLNEIKYAEQLLNSGCSGRKPSEIVWLLMRYFAQIKGMRDADILKNTVEYLDKNCVGFNESRWTKTLEKYMKKCRKSPIYGVDSIDIGRSEIMKISSLGKPRLERLMFTLVCLAKYNNIHNRENNNWVFQKASEIFRMAQISASVKTQDSMLHELYNKGYIRFSRKAGSSSINVLIIDDLSEAAMSVSDFRTLGYEYEQWKTNKYTRCVECGVLIKQNKNRTRQKCSDCARGQLMRTKTVDCVDCGRTFAVKSKNNTTNRCPSCCELHNLVHKIPSP